MRKNTIVNIRKKLTRIQEGIKRDGLAAHQQDIRNIINQLQGYVEALHEYITWMKVDDNGWKVYAVEKSTIESMTEDREKARWLITELRAIKKGENLNEQWVNGTKEEILWANIYSTLDDLQHTQHIKNMTYCSNKCCIMNEGGKCEKQCLSVYPGDRCEDCKNGAWRDSYDSTFWYCTIPENRKFEPIIENTEEQP